MAKKEYNETESSLKLSLYLTLKNLYDKWICTYDPNRFILKSPQKEREETNSKIKGNKCSTTNISEFSNFLYVDNFYRDIGDVMMINPMSLIKVIQGIRDGSNNRSLFQVMDDIAKDNKLMFMCLPLFNNYYDADSIEDIFRPDPTTRMGVSDGSTYLLMYTGSLSKKANTSQDDPDEKYRDDSIDIADVNGKINQEIASTYFSEQETSKTGNALSIRVPAFGITYARQNQNYFTNITVNMDSPKITDFSIRNQIRLSKQTVGSDGNPELDPITIGQDAYSIFANQSFNCTVEMLGCMNIMPMMYFQLNNIPLFRGAYFITNVEHNITPGKMITKFVGTRISKTQVPYKSEVFGLAPAMTAFIQNNTGVASTNCINYYSYKEFNWNDFYQNGEIDTKNDYFDTSVLKTGWWSRWTIGEVDDKNKGINKNNNLCPISSERVNNIWPFGKEFNVKNSSEEYGYSKFSIINWISQCYKPKGIITYDVMCNIFWDTRYIGNFGFGLLAEYNLITDDENNKQVNGTTTEFRKCDVAIMRVINLGRVEHSFTHYMIYVDENIGWVGDKVYGNKLWPFSSEYTLQGSTTIRVYRFGEKIFQNEDNDYFKMLKDAEEKLKKPKN